MTDDAGRIVRLDQPATRVVSLYGALSDAVAALGAADLLVGRTDADLRSELAAAEPVGTHMRPNIERIVALHPDLVVQMGSRPEARAALEPLEALGIPTAYFEAETVDEVLEMMQRLGALLGREDAATAWTAQARSRLGRVAEAVAGQPRPRVIFEIRYPNLLLAGSDSVVSDIIARAGGENAMAAPDRVVRASEELLYSADADWYLVQQGPMNPSPEPPAQRPHFGDLPCVRAGQVAVLDERRFSRPGPGVVDAVEELAAILHPDRFKGGEVQP